MKAEKRFEFLKIEFPELYKLIEGLYLDDENELNLIGQKVLEYIVSNIYRKNILYEEKEQKISYLVSILYEVKIIPSYIESIFKVIESELIEYKENLDLVKNYSADKNLVKEKFLEKCEFELYQLIAWFVVNIGEENYLLFNEGLDDKEKEAFQKAYTKPKEMSLTIVNQGKIKSLTEVEVQELVEKGENYLFSKNTNEDKEKALKFFLEAVNYGNDAAKAYIGMFYEKGIKVKKDIKIAMKWYTIASNKGIPFAQFELGLIYFKGDDVEKDYKKALIFFEKSAENKYSPAYYYIGRCYQYGLGVDEDKKQAIEAYTKGALLERGDSQFSLALMYKNGEGCEQNIIKAYYWLEKAAENDYENAFYIIGKSYLEGSYYETDYEKAFHYLTKGYEAFDTDCVEALGDMYFRGLSVEENKLKALELYHIGMELGNEKMYYKIGKIYEDEGLIEESLKYYIDGSNIGEKRCIQRLGVIYYNGEGVERDLEKAIDYMKKAAEENEPHAMYMLGVAYIRLNKLGKDTYKVAKEVLEKAYELKSAYAAEYLAYLMLAERNEGHIIDEKILLEYIDFGVENELKDSIFQYGYICENGIGVVKDLEKAHDYYRIAAERGSIKAMLSLADGYKKGDFLSRNIEKSIKWYTKASDLGDIEAIEKLIEIYEKGIGGEKSEIKALNYVFKLIDLDALKGKSKLVYYCLKEFGIDRNEERALEILKEIEDIDKGTANNLKAKLATEGLINLEKKEIINLYLEGIELGNSNCYGDLAVYLYEENLCEENKEHFDLAISGKDFGDLKSMYIYLKKIMEEKLNNIIITEEEMLIFNKLRRLISKGMYEIINDLIKWHEVRKKTDTIFYYKLKEDTIFFNI